MTPRFRPHLETWELLGLVGSRRGNPSGFEAAFSRRYGYSHSVWFPLGRLAVQAYLESLNAPGRGVVVSAFNCVALGNAVAAAKRRPFYVDTEPDGYNQDPVEFLRALADPDTAAGIVVSQWGIPPAQTLERPAGKPLLHDFALRSLDPRVPQLGERDAVVYSFNWGKPVAFLSGAMLCTSNGAMAESWRKWRDGRLRSGVWLRDFFQGLQLKLAFHPALFGLALRLTSLKAADRLSGNDGKLSGEVSRYWYRVPCDRVFGGNCQRLAELDPLRKERRAQMDRYGELFSEVQGLNPPPAEAYLSHYPVRVEHPQRLQAYLRRHGVFSSIALFDRLLCDYPWLAGRKMSSLSRSRLLTQTTLHLPLYHGLDSDVQHRIGELVRRWDALETKEGVHRVA